jgi:hypothetical protein
MLAANSSIVRAQRALWKHPPDVQVALLALSEAERSDYFKNDPVVGRIKDLLKEAPENAEKRIEALRLLESRSLLSQYMTRSRKREVLETRVERAPQVLSVSFSPAELAIYDHVTERIRAQAIGKSGVSLFALVARQRQMASSIVGALESWDEKGLTEELLWEDFGLTSGLVMKPIEPSHEDRTDVPSLPDDDGSAAFGFKFDITELERGDQKYLVLHSFLTQELRRTPREKFVVFAFYRNTLKYLARRLKADGISATLLMGALGVDTNELLQRFAHPDGPSVLLSSEVGSQRPRS